MTSQVYNTDFGDAIASPMVLDESEGAACKPMMSEICFSSVFIGIPDNYSCQSYELVMKKIGIPVNTTTHGSDKSLIGDIGEMKN